MNPLRPAPKRAFTIIELLVVIAIMAVVAGLIVGLAGVAGDNKKLKRTEAELANLVLLIEQYKTKVGVYPPQNPNTNFWHYNTLLYELAGATNNGAADPLYLTPYGNILASTLQTSFGVGGIINSHGVSGADPDANRTAPVLKNLKSDQAAEVVPNTRSLVVPVDDRNGQRPNPWRYRVGNSVDSHNPETFDLWVEIKLGTTNGVAKTKIIGNWKN